LPDASVDVVTSNGVLNLVPDKRRAISEIFRVLRPGGRVQIADIIIDVPVTPDCKDDPQLWAECVVGATVDEAYLNLFRDAGFEAVMVLHHYDYFAHSPSEETQQVAHRFGARALELGMRRAQVAPSPVARWMRRLSPVRALDACRRRGLWGMLGLVAAVLACYGTLALVGLLSAMGASLVGPLLPAILGFGLIAYTMFGVYSRFVELTGFTMLACAALWDYRLRRYGGAKPHVARHGVVAVPDRQTD
jgi:hypothetical protein